jgi:4-amino-4-deoxy-L-arabinose transferase-like glycosyltransferase
LDAPFLSGNRYLFLFSLLAVVYSIGLFVPLMDNDAAHHANIALHMHLTGDYVNLIDFGKDYLDKPHLHFWLSAFSYKIFGVTTFAYKFPSFLFTIAGIYSVFRLGKALYNIEAGKLAALIFTSAFAVILSNNDVRMDAILTACVAFASWQAVEFIHYKKLLNAAGLALGMALGFCTKGHIAVLTPVTGLFFYILYRKEWDLFRNRKWLFVIVCFAILIFPVVYCYYLQFNLHPEKIVRGKNNINGMKFILLNQSAERFGGEMGAVLKTDYLFFLHSFLWTFAPWSVICYWTAAGRIKNLFKRETEWFTVSTILSIALLLSLSGFKLPHYLNIVFPAAAVLTASWIIANERKAKIIFILQLLLAVFALLFAALLNFFVFPVRNYFIVAAVAVLLAVVFHFFKTRTLTIAQKAICVSSSSVILIFFLLNSNFYPQLLKYQAGNELALKTKDKLNPQNVYFWKENYHSAYNFYSSTLRRQFADSVLQPGKKLWLLFHEAEKNEIEQSGYSIGQWFGVQDFEITRLDKNFLNPATREHVLKKIVLAEITRSQ